MPSINKPELSYYKVFRLFFVVFSLYLMGDAFYRWDGFRYHSSFAAFLPSVALVSIFWTIIAVLTSIVVWLFVKALERLFLLGNIKVRVELLVLLFIFLGISGTIAVLIKSFIFRGGVSILIKLILVIGVILSTIIFTWLCRHKFDIIQDRITPLVWLYGMLIVLFIPFTAYIVTYSGTGQQQSTGQYLSAHSSRPNIILLTFDALTAQNMSLYGYNRITTPFISSWAREATVFSKVEAESNLTIPTVASMMTGKRVWTHQLYHHLGSHVVKSETENLPLLLEKNGYTTIGIVTNQMHASPKILGISKNFHVLPSEYELIGSTSTILDKIESLLSKLFFGKIRFYNWIIDSDFILGRTLNILYINKNTVTLFPPQKVFNRFLKVMDETPGKPFFAWIHLYPPHHPYLPPKPYIGMFDPSPEFRTNKSQDDLIMVSFPVISRRRPGNDVQSIVDTLRARYDEFIRFSDKQFEDFINQLKKIDNLENTIIILSSDHGESFEHNYVGHDGGLYEEQTHIPLIIKEPDQSHGKIISDLVEQIDIPATILNFAQIEIPSWMEGKSLVPLIRGEKLPSSPAFSMNFSSNPSRGNHISRGCIVIWDGDYKLMQCIGTDMKPLLFNLKQDPDELNTLFDKETDVSQRLLKLVEDNLNKANKKISREQ